MSGNHEQGSSRPLVLHVIDSLDISGGAEKQLVANLRHFDRDRLAHEVAVIKQPANTRDAEVGKLVPIHQLVSPMSKTSRARVITGLRQLSRERRPSLIHASLPDAALATRIVAKLDGVPAVESLVNISHERVRTIDNPNVTATKLAIHTIQDRITMKALVGFHAVSRAVADSWTRVVGINPEKLEVIPRGIEVDWLTTSEEERRAATESVYDEFDLPRGAPLLISVGRVEPQKGHRYLVEAVAYLKDRHPNLTALIVGRPGHASMAVETAISTARLNSAIILTGSREDLPRLLAAADIFVFPSLFEGNGGNAMMEAMAAGLPIVTTNEPPMTDLIPDSNVGLLVNRCDPASLAQAIERIINDRSLAARLSSASQARANRFMTPREAAARHEKWYMSLIA